MKFYNQLMTEFLQMPLDVSDKHTFENYFSPFDPAFDGDIDKVKDKYKKLRIWLAYLLYYVKLRPEYDNQKQRIKELIDGMDEKYEELLQDVGSFEPEGEGEELSVLVFTQVRRSFFGHDNSGGSILLSLI